MEQKDSGRRQDYARFSDWGNNIKPIRNEDMQCADCRYRTGETIACEKYSVKPGEVLDGKPACPLYSKK
jgi:hypothetical protein